MGNLSWSSNLEVQYILADVPYIAIGVVTVACAIILVSAERFTKGSVDIISCETCSRLSTVIYGTEL